MKTCSKCKIEKPFEAFHRNKDKLDGYLPYCIECERVRRLELKNNPLMQLEKELRSSVILENKLLKRENKKLCTRCKEIFLIDDLSGGIICKECSAKKNKEFNEKNNEKVNVYYKEYYEKNKEKINEYRRERRLKKKLEKQNNT